MVAEQHRVFAGAAGGVDGGAGRRRFAGPVNSGEDNQQR
jgi:hypothetical protein